MKDLNVNSSFLNFSMHFNLMNYFHHLMNMQLDAKVDKYSLPRFVYLNRHYIKSNLAHIFKS